MSDHARTKVLWARETELSAGRQNHRAQHTFYHLYVLRSGSGVLCYGEKRFHLKGGQCLLVHPFVQHETPKDLHNLISFYEVKFEVYDAYLNEKLNQVDPVFELSPFIETCLRFIITHWNQTDPQMQRNVDDMLSAMLISVCVATDAKEESSNCIDISNYNSKIKKIIHYIENHFDEHFRLEQLASLFELNLNYMCAIFKKQTGHTIIEYLNYVRIRHCINAFYYGRDRMIEVALAAGFSNASHFNRIFRKYLGTTPTIFRNYYSVAVLESEESAISPRLYEKNIELRIAPTMDDAFNTMKELGYIAKMHDKS